MANQQQGQQQYVVSGSLGHGKRTHANNNPYRDGEIFESETASEAEIAQFVSQGVLVTPQRHAQMAVAHRITGTSDVEMALQRLRGLQGGHLQSVIRLNEELMDPRGRSEREGHHAVARILQKIRGERDPQRQAADKYAAQIAETEAAGQEVADGDDGE